MVYPFCNASESCMRLCIVPSLILCHVYATVATHVVLSGHEMDNPQSYKIKLQNLNIVMCGYILLKNIHPVSLSHRHPHTVAVPNCEF